MTLEQAYKKESSWQAKVTIMELYHLTMSSSNSKWTLTNTAKQFEVSIGLVSENLKLAHAIHSDPKLLDCTSRDKALKRMYARR